MSVVTALESAEDAPARCGSCTEANGDVACGRCGRQYSEGSASPVSREVDAWAPAVQVPRSWTVVVAVAVAVAVVAVVATPIVLEYTRPPEDAVTGALAASRSGDPADIAEWFALGSSAASLNTMPRVGDHVPPSKVSVRRVVNNDRDRTTVTVAYSVGANRQVETVTVVRDGLFAPWRIDAEPPVLDVGVGWDVAVRVAGVREDPGGVTVAPGAYRVVVDHKLFTAEPKTVVVGLNGGTVELDPRLSDEAVDAASEVIGDVVDGCAAATEHLTLQSDCPFFETRPRFPEPESVSWTITAYPEIRLDTDKGELRVHTERRGVAELRLTYEQRDAKTYECGFNVDGVMELSRGEMSWHGNPMTNLDGCDRS